MPKHIRVLHKTSSGTRINNSHFNFLHILQSETEIFQIVCNIIFKKM